MVDDATSANPSSDIVTPKKHSEMIQRSASAIPGARWPSEPCSRHSVQTTV